MKSIVIAAAVIVLTHAFSLRASDETHSYKDTFMKFANGYLRYQDIFDVDQDDLSALYDHELIGGNLLKLQYVLESLAATTIDVHEFVHLKGIYNKGNTEVMIMRANADKNHKYFSTWRQMEFFNQLKGDATCRDKAIEAKMQDYISCQSVCGHQLSEDKFRIILRPNLRFIEDELKSINVR